jgi:phosphoserine phosphatase
MDQKEQGTTANDKAAAVRNERPRALEISERGIRTGADFANVMSALMGDLIAGRVTPQVGNATCNVGGKLLKIVEMQHRYGTTGDSENSAKILRLADVPVAKAA